ncbi:Protein F38A5.6 [Aphelenchoides avenae]|nr:Protein F38A5.6 [Aphelenchus avenae]
MSVDEKSQRSQRTQRSTQRSQRSQQSRALRKEIASASCDPGAAARFGRAKLRIIQTLGVKQKTKYPDTFLAGMEELENYTKSLQKVANDLCGLLQQNPKLLPEPLGKMEVEPPAGQDPFEQLGQTLNSVSTMLDDKKLISRYIELTAKLAEQHREFQKTGRRVIHSIRTFLNVNYIDLIDMRKELTNYRDYMDMKKYELENAKTPEMINVKNKEYEEALREYTNHLAKITSLLDGLAVHKETHTRELTKFFAAYRKYHENCIQAAKA